MKIYHTNVVPTLKEWKPVCKSDFVWVQVVDEPMMSDIGRDRDVSDDVMEQAA